MSFKELVCFIQIIKFGGMEFSVVLLYYYPFNGMLLSFSMGSVLMTQYLIYAVNSSELTTLLIVQNQEAIGFLVVCLNVFPSLYG